MNAKLTGILTDVFPTEPINANFQKRVFWLKQPDTVQYPQHWEIELHQQEVRRLDQYNIGDSLEVDVEIRGRQFSRRDTSRAIVITLKATGIKFLGGPGYKHSGGKPQQGAIL